jgi:hypothetical protein
MTIVNIPVGSGSGTSDHAVLSNLDYASAGHTGFASETLFDDLSGAHYVTDATLTDLSGSHAATKSILTNLSGSFWGLSGSNLTAHNTLGTNINTVSGSLINLSGAYYIHAADSSDPHGVVLTQTGILSSGMVSGSAMTITSDVTISGSARVLNILYGTDAAPPTASGFPIGSIYVQYIP